MLATLFDSSTFAIAHDAKVNCLYVMWRGTQTAEGTQAKCALLLQQVKRHRIRYLLNDSSQSLDGWHEVGRWLEMDFFPLLANNGIRAIAWVNAKDWPARTATSQVLRHTTRPLLDTFDDVEAAHTWLSSLPA